MQPLQPLRRCSVTARRRGSHEQSMQSQADNFVRCDRRLVEHQWTSPRWPRFRQIQDSITGQINPGSTHPVTSQSKEVTNIPTPEESRQALLEPYSKQPSLGNSPSVPRPEPETFGGPNANQESQNAVGGPRGLTTAGSTPNPSASKAGRQTASTPSATDEPPPSGPIGSFGQTIPAKFSKRNDILDRTPIMGWPLPLTDQQRTQI